MARTNDMTATDCQDALLRYFSAYRGYRYQLCNAYVFRWESDFWCLASSGYSYEVEVKVSRSDFFADFKKERKHRVLQKAHQTEGPFTVRVGCGYSAGQVRPGTQFFKQVIYAPYRENGHPRNYNQKDPLYLNIQWKDPTQVCPNRFAFAVPEGLVDPEEVPRYAGLIWVLPDRRKKPLVVKKPPAIHRGKRDFSSLLLDKYYWAYLKSLGHSKAGKNFRFPDEKRQRMVRTK